MNKRNSSLLTAFGIGATAGLRTFTPAAIVSQAASRNLIRLRRSPVQKLKSSLSVGIMTTLAVGELIGDKLPFAPSRLGTGPLAARVASGAMCGAVLCGAPLRSTGKTIALGAVLGGVGAIAGAYVGYHLRHQLVSNFNVPDAALAVAEDMLAVGGAAAIVARSASVVSFATRGYL